MVEYIEYNDKKYPIRVSYFVLQNFKQETGKTFDEASQQMQKTGDLSMYEKVLWLALQSGARVMKQELDIKEEDIAYVLDDCFYEFLDLLPKLLPQQEGGDVKKPTGNRAQRRAQEQKGKKK